MRTKNIKQAPSLPAPPQVVFDAWLDSKLHGAMIGGSAKIDARVGGKFSIWDDYATGVNLEIDPSKLRIVQSWRDNSTDWPKDHFSKITLEFTAEGADPAGTRLRFWHSGIPEKHAASIAQGWKDYYWEPMQRYFEAK